MSHHSVCLSSNAIGYPDGGGHLWVYLNWALGLRDAGANVIWLEAVNPLTPEEQTLENARILRERLAVFGFDHSLVLFRADDSGERPVAGYAGIEAATDADLLLNFDYGLSGQAVRRFRKTALVDIDPGMTQTWIGRNEVQLTPHDHYFTIGETVGRNGSPIPDLGLTWHYTAPAVSLPAWPTARANTSAPFTAISHWYSDEWLMDLDGQWYLNNKREGLLPFIDIPKLTRQPVELAICLGDDEEDRQKLTRHGWRVVHSANVTNTPEAYQRYIQQSRGEFGWAKPSYVKLQTAWVSDRTICYLASGKPAVVRNTGSSRFLPDRLGLLRYDNPTEAAKCLEEVAANYDKHSAAARALAEEYFDAAKVARKVLEIALS